MKNNTRRIAAAVLAFCITAGTMPAMNYRTVFPTAYAAEEEGTYVAKDGMVYKEYSDHISLFYCEPDGDTVYIPDTIDGKPVTEIGRNAFTSRFDELNLLADDKLNLLATVKKIYIPEGIEVIGDYAFIHHLKFEGYKEVHLPSTLKKVGYNAFSGNTVLNVYGLPDTAEVDETAFSGTWFDLETRSNYFRKNDMIYTEFPDHISLVYCELDGDTLNIPDTIDGKPVTELDANAFNVNYLRLIDCPANLDGVKKVIIPEGVEEIGIAAFKCSDGEGLYEVYLPSTLKKVGENAFKKNKKLNVYGLPETAELESGAFDDTCFDAEKRCNKIKKDGMIYYEYSDYIELYYCEPDGDILYIPGTIDDKPVKKIADNAFNDFYYIGVVDGETQVLSRPMIESVKTIVIPEGVEEIGKNAFSGEYRDDYLYEVYLPSSLKKVDCAFPNNKRMRVYGLPEDAEIDRNAFSNTYYYNSTQRNKNVKTDDMVYIEYSDHVSLIYCKPDGDTLYIPDTIAGKPVTEIQSNVDSEFFDIPDFSDTVRKLYIPEGVEVIGKDAFRCDLDKEGIYEVHLPSTLKKVCDGAFYCNKNLNVFGLPETAKVEYSAFEGTRYIYGERANFIVKDGMYYWEYPDHIFLNYCEPDGDTLYIPDTIDGKPVTSVCYGYDPEEKLFKTPELPDSVKKVYIPEGVEEVGGFECPEGNEGLFEVHLPSTLKKVWYNAFNFNKYLNVYGLPETVKFDREAFYVTRYDYVKRANFIVKDGMYYWEYPDHIDLLYCEPDGDTLYIPDMIDGKPVTSVCYEYDPEEKLFKTPELPDSVKKIYIPEGVEEVRGFGCPEGKDSIYEVHFPSTLKIVYCGAFVNQKNLNVYGLPETAKVEWSSFDGTRYCYELRDNLIVKDGMIYEEYPDHIDLFYCEPEGDTLYIPDMIDGKPVTAICGKDEMTFNPDYYGIEIPSLPDTVKDVVIPEGIKVGEKAFEGTKFEGKFTTKPASKIAYGDVNLDGKVTLADSLAILQFIANEDKYPLSAEAQKNADCYNPGDGITGNDAVAVMRYDTKVVSELPIFEK